MNGQEALAWVSGLLPLEPTVEHHRSGPADGFGVDVALVRVGGEDATSGAPAPPETVAFTLDAARIDAGLTTADGSDLRVEFLTVVSGHGPEAAALVTAAAAITAGDPVAHSPQPGTVLAGLADRLPLAGAGQRPPSARHGLLVPPYLWDRGVPHFHEVTAGGRRSATGTANVEFTHPGRLTVPIQVVMITDAELALLHAEGIDAVQARLVDSGADLNNIWR
ncbi:hypothetical protein DLJ54_01465 [Corynebacterium heidelbergense]|uniref:Suppressor of fused-like domain-containing protein n=1 Tax=Corynebacterium heidelbergense TaxID=2055947 RepID=A0A364V834_9CORY|nr:hypothetical protein DLJ54_01465 [Corynebacterium heidelbergense]